MIFAEAAREWLRYVQEDRAAKPSTLSQYRSSVHAHFLPAFGDWPLQAVRAQWRRRP